MDAKVSYKLPLLLQWDADDSKYVPAFNTPIGEVEFATMAQALGVNIANPNFTIPETHEERLAALKEAWYYTDDTNC